ncbi:hypothetical protein L3Y34_006580 [Caenorhabditis briggsae]|uniref:RING-type domain-containing protein n=1 Tax=Caenorhabditis briggsae TaxID=6238 RepID=A0AAE9A037_CAEBR|nr:hypothetical protein L3Y34_006580 [Caenorhabditis briggsae]
MLTIASKDMVLSSENVKKLVKRCVPNELIPVDWKCDQSDIRSNLESLLECSRGLLGMFENVNDLFQTLANFLTVPGCATMLQFDGDYSTLPATHMSIKGVHYMYKMDVLELISLAVPCPFEGWQAELVRLAVKSRLKCFEAEWKSRFNSHCEMIKVDLKVLKMFAENLHECSIALFKNTELCVPPLPDFSNPTIEVESTDGCYEILKSFDEKYPIAKNKTFYARMFSWIATVGKLFKKVLEESFMSADDSKATVRLFKIGKNSYVMAHELLQSMRNKNMDVSEFEGEVLKMRNLATFNFREVAQKVKIGDMKNIEFIGINGKVSVTSIPLPAPDGTYCVPATDALYDLISDIIVAKKVLQRINRSQFEHIINFFESVEHIFRHNGGDYFISMEDVEWVKAKWEKTYEENLKSSVAVKHIRKVRKGGFTEDDLDKELEYLNLYNCLPEMKREVKWAYKLVTKERNSTLKLEDMHSAVFQCQMTILLENLPNVYQFLHSQKMCMKWVSYVRCVFCEKPRLETLLNKSSRTEEEEQELMEMTTVSLVPPSPKESDVVVEEKNQEVLSDIPKKKRSRKAKKSEESSSPTPSDSPSSPELEMPESSKESQSCLKCSRASHFADVANEKLRVSKVECKHLKKELANVELEVEVQKQKGLDKDERIRILEKLLKSKDDIIERQNMDLLQKQDVIMNLEMEVESKEIIIQEKSTTIENLEKSLKRKDYRINELEAPQSSEFRIMEPTRSDEETEKVRDVLFKLLEIQGTLRSGNPVGKCRELAQRICMKAHNKEIEDATRIEAIKFCEKAKIYIQTPKLPEFPALSRGFLKTYEDIFKSEAPKICQSLLKTPEVKPGELADTDCLICIEEMESEEGTIKCECCKRRYHTECAQEWFKTKRTCPACSSALLDDSEFPTLGQR